MTMPALCQIQPWQQAEWGVMGACTYLMADMENEISERYYQYCGRNTSISCATDFYPHTLTMWSSADVSGHARSTLPCPTICSNTDSVLSVHFKVTDVHILEDGIWGRGGRDIGRYGKISKSTSARMVRGGEEGEQTQEAIRKRRKDGGRREDEDYRQNVKSKSYQHVNVKSVMKVVYLSTKKR